MNTPRLVVCVLMSATLASCTSAPKSAAPQLRGAHAQALAVCPGRVSNAPSTDGRGRIAQYSPYAEIRGNALARAPVPGCLSSGFGPRRGGAGRYHEGVDLFTRSPAPIGAAGDGVVESAGVMRGYGNVITVRHRNGVATRYAHLSALSVRKGAHVRRGQTIGRTGETGNATAVHLHYEVLVDGRPVNPLTVGR
jgi:murein DD-endopeptidase MepM/ murein hydrolase activator NlpD